MRTTTMLPAPGTAAFEMLGSLSKGMPCFSTDTACSAHVQALREMGWTVECETFWDGDNGHQTPPYGVSLMRMHYLPMREAARAAEMLGVA